MKKLTRSQLRKILLNEVQLMETKQDALSTYKSLEHFGVDMRWISRGSDLSPADQLSNLSDAQILGLVDDAHERLSSIVERYLNDRKNKQLTR